MEKIKLFEGDIALAGEFLVKGWAGVRSTTQCKTFDEFRLERYIGGNSGIDTLPPTSSANKGTHPQRRSTCIYCRSIHLLDPSPKELAGRKTLVSCCLRKI